MLGVRSPQAADSGSAPPRSQSPVGFEADLGAAPPLRPNQLFQSINAAQRPNPSLARHGGCKSDPTAPLSWQHPGSVGMEAGRLSRQAFGTLGGWGILRES